MRAELRARIARRSNCAPRAHLADGVADRPRERAARRHLFGEPDPRRVAVALLAARVVLVAELVVAHRYQPLELVHTRHARAGALAALALVLAEGRLVARERVRHEVVVALLRDDRARVADVGDVDRAALEQHDDRRRPAERVVDRRLVEPLVHLDERLLVRLLEVLRVLLALRFQQPRQLVAHVAGAVVARLAVAVEHAEEVQILRALVRHEVFDLDVRVLIRLLHLVRVVPALRDPRVPHAVAAKLHLQLLERRDRLAAGRHRGGFERWRRRRRGGARRRRRRRPAAAAARRRGGPLTLAAQVCEEELILARAGRRDLVGLRRE